MANGKDNLNVGILIVDKLGVVKELKVKNYVEEDLYKKCAFKKVDGFSKQCDWEIKMDGMNYMVSVFGKIDGRANTENKYDFPPPIDSTLFFGSCAIVGKDSSTGDYVSLTNTIWNKMYEKLFGGFEDLALTSVEDDAEEDELANVPDENKTKDGYLKDNFVVDSDENDEDDIFDSEEESEMQEETTSDDDEIEPLDDIGSELSEEAYSDEEY